MLQSGVLLIEELYILFFININTFIKERWAIEVHPPEIVT